MSPWSKRLAWRGENSYLRDLAIRADRVFLILAGLLVTVSAGMAFSSGDWWPVLAVSVPSGLLVLSMTRLFPGQRITRVAVAAAFMVITAAIIHQGRGLVELHFGIFVLIALLLYYRDWLPVVVAAAVIAVHHLAFYVLQGQGAGVYAFAPDTGFGLVLVHAAYVVVETVVVSLMAVDLRRQAEAQGLDPSELAELAREVADERPVPSTARQARVADGSLAQSLIRMSDTIIERRSRERAANEENLRVKVALDASSTCVMIADAEGIIRYANPAVLQMLRAQVDELRKDLPDFDPDEVVGGSIDRFHARPEHQRRMLAGLTAPHKARIRVGGAHFSLAVSPVKGQEGEQVGFAVEWFDRTAEVGVEREVGEIIEAASVGVLDRRVALEGKQGFHLVLADGVNSLLDTQQASVNAVQEVLSAMARGDLTRTIDADFQGAFGEIKRDANRTVEQLRRIVAGIQRSAEAINVAAGEIAAGNNDLSRRTESQAASLEETASSMEELTATVRQNAEHAREARGLAGGASQAAERGGSVVGEVVQTMAGISESSKRIGDIIGVIDGIAFQTNILALNAAVEAARAGEQGRGFAVVASEVRSLAQRSADAAREIKQLISESTRRVGEGSQLVDQAGAAMGEIVEQVHRVSGIIAEIAAASDEQAAGIEQVNGTVTQMDEVTQQNAALVEEASASARALEEQAGGLAEAVAIFRLEATATAR